MIIYPLPPHELDDVSLDKQIKAIAQVLVRVVYFITKNANTPLNPFKKMGKQEEIYFHWARSSRANYLKLVGMGVECSKERNYRKGAIVKDPKSPIYKLMNVILWARDNIPELLDITEVDQCVALYTGDGTVIPERSDEATAFPLCVPDNYNLVKKNKKDLYSHYIEILIDESYRNYYRAKIHKKISDLDSSETEAEITLARKLQIKGIKWTRREIPGFLKGVVDANN
jgi:hypothetical protein